MLINNKVYESLKEKSVTGRYVINEQIDAFLKLQSTTFKVQEIGKSVENRIIKCITLGSGPKRILMWSQMHGNESTTTKAVLDLINLLGTTSLDSNKILEACTIKIIPMLNPDGAFYYTRVNASDVDLNRDAQERNQPESKVLRETYDDFKPHFCFNLHDQRTIFNVGRSEMPATLSFLAPAHDENRTISKTRERSMQVIAAINVELQKLIPGQIGRFDDTFNANCVGDAFQMLGTPTILFEAGHFKNDYQREQTRFFVFQALWIALTTISMETYEKMDKSDYFEIPENNKLFFDVLVKRADHINPRSQKNFDVGILFKEVLEEGAINFVPQIASVGNLDSNYGHKTFNCLINSDLEKIKEEEFWNLLKK